MDLKPIFYNDNGRVRSGLRFVLFLLAYLVTATVFVGLAGAILTRLPIGFAEPGLLRFTLPYFLSAAAAVILGWLFGRFFEDLPFRALGASFTKNWLRDFLCGAIVGIGSIGFAVLIAYMFGGMRFEINRNAGSSAILLTLSATLVIFVFGAIAEETLFRGYLLQTFTRVKLFWVGALLTSAIFASGHLANPNASAFAWLNTFLAGIWLASAYFKTRTLWFAFGIHLLWNWVQGAYFGISVSGLSELATAPVMRVTETGSEMIGGGSYGIEGGIACTVALIVSTILIWFLPLIRPTEEMWRMSGEEKPLREPAGSA